MRKPALSLLAAAGISLLAGPAFSADTIKIGNIVAASGYLKGAAEPSLAAFDIAVAEINAAGGINGKQIELIRFDTGSDPKQASVAARQMIEDDKVLAILGPFSSGETRIAMTTAERLGALMIPTAASAPGLVDGAKWTWRLTEDETKQFSRLLSAIKAAGLPSATADIVYVSDDVVANTAGTKLYGPLMEKAGIKVGEPIPVQQKSFDMAAQAAQIVSAKPDLVAVAALPDAASKIIKELRRQGYQGRIIGSQIFSDPYVVDLFGPEGEGTLMVAGFWKGSSAKSAAFDANLLAELAKRGNTHKKGAHHSDAQAYDGVYLLKQVMEAAGVTGDPAKLQAEREAILAKMEGVSFSGVVGDNVCFAGHDAELPGYSIEIKNGQWTKFAEAPADKCN